MDSIQRDFEFFRKKMLDKGVSPHSINIFNSYYTQLREGQTGFISEEQIRPVEDLLKFEELSQYELEGRQNLNRVAVIKLNGGLGTSMGMEGAKSLLPAKNQMSFLEVIIRQMIRACEVNGTKTPLMLMNSENTRENSLKMMRKFPQIDCGLPMDFLQQKTPKIRQDNFLPVEYASNPDMEWCPPGHGDIYYVMHLSGLIDALLLRGIQYAFISNADNLGAVVDASILGYMIKTGTPFIMEVAGRTHDDRKGGHLFLMRGNRLGLREIAQCPPNEIEEFQNIQKYKYFNTNTIWLNLQTLKSILIQKSGYLNLQLIRNSKTVDPKDKLSTPVFQLETAMGSAISLFEGASAIHVPRSRFIPVKTGQDLILLWSDIYELTPDFALKKTKDSQDSLTMRLDPRYYYMVHHLKTRFPDGAPSLKLCDEWTVEGDFRFGKGVVLQGRVTFKNAGSAQINIPDGVVFKNRILSY